MQPYTCPKCKRSEISLVRPLISPLVCHVVPDGQPVPQPPRDHWARCGCGHEWRLDLARRK